MKHPKKESTQQGSLMGPSAPDDEVVKRPAGAPWQSRTKNGYDLDLAISALQKAIRRGRTNEALFWGDELWTSGYQAYFWRRMMIIAHEECASDLTVAPFLAACHYNAMVASQNGKGRVEGLIEAHAILVLSRATKSREACDAAMAVMVAKREGWRIQPHPSAADKHTRAGKRLGKTMADFGNEGRLVAGRLGPNVFELKHWGFIQPPLPRPHEAGGEPDVEIPDHTDYHLRGGAKNDQA